MSRFCAEEYRLIQLKRSTIAAAASAVILIASVSQASTFTYTAANTTNSAATADSWANNTGSSWSGVPISAADTILVFNIPTSAGITRYTKDDIASPPFLLNSMTIQGTGASAAADTLNIQGTALEFAGSTPTINLNANKNAAGGSTAAVNVANALTLDADTNFTGSGTAAYTFSSNVGGPGNVIITTAGITFGGTIAGNVTLNSNAGITFKELSNYTYGGTITGTGGKVTQAGSGTTLILTGTNSYTGATSITSGTTLQGADTGAHTISEAAATVLGNGSIVVFTGNGTLQLRANGLTNSTQVLTFANKLQASAGMNATVDVDRQTSTGGSNVTLAVRDGINFNNSTLNVTGGDGFIFQSTGATAINQTVTFNPTTANIILGAVSSANNATSILALDGTSANNLISGAITGTATAILSLNKTGLSTWTLSSNSNNYTNGTTVTGGSLVLTNASGSATGTTGVSVGASGTLAGTGFSTGALSLSGTIAPGVAGIGTLHTGSLTSTGGTYAAQINSTLANADDIAITGNLALASGATLSLADLGSAKMALNSVLTLMSYSGTYDGGTFTGYANDSQFVLGLNTFKINYGSSTNKFVTLTAVPEPASLALVGLGGVAALVRRRKQS